jgi:hypothetical protein
MMASVADFGLSRALALGQVSTLCGSTLCVFAEQLALPDCVDTTTGSSTMLLAGVVPVDSMRVY